MPLWVVSLSMQGSRLGEACYSALVPTLCVGTQCSDALRRLTHRWAASQCEIKSPEGTAEKGFGKGWVLQGF